MGIISHKFRLQTHRGKGDFVSSIVGTANPLTKKGKRSSSIEEARCHLEVSLVVQVEGLDLSGENNFCNQIASLLQTIKIAGGDVLSFRPPEISCPDDEDEKSEAAFLCSLMPGYALLERRNLMLEAMREGKNALQALVDGVSVRYVSEKDDKGKVTWKSSRKYEGWTVPIATGFHGITKISEAGTTLNQRDPTVPHRFAESVVTLGEFVMPYKLDRVKDLLWRYEYIKNKNLYVCQNTKGA